MDASHNFIMQWKRPVGSLPQFLISAFVTLICVISTCLQDVMVIVSKNTPVDIYLTIKKSGGQLTIKFGGQLTMKSIIKMSSKFVPDPEILSLLTSMGYSAEQAKKALKYTGNKSAELAASWLLDFVGAELSDDNEFPEMAEFLDDTDFYKMVFVVDTSLGMGVGKVAAQVSHATLGLYRVLIADQKSYGEMMLAWEQFGETKIVLQGDDVNHLKTLASKAASLNLPHYLVQDAGKTQIPAGSITTLAIIGKNDEVDKVTGDLSLL